MVMMMAERWDVMFGAMSKMFIATGHLHLSYLEHVKLTM